MTAQSQKNKKLVLGVLVLLLALGVFFIKILYFQASDGGTGDKDENLQKVFEHAGSLKDSVVQSYEDLSRGLNYYKQAKELSGASGMDKEKLRIFVREMEVMADKKKVEKLPIEIREIAGFSPNGWKVILTTIGADEPILARALFVPSGECTQCGAKAAEGDECDDVLEIHPQRELRFYRTEDWKQIDEQSTAGAGAAFGACEARAVFSGEMYVVYDVCENETSCQEFPDPKIYIQKYFDTILTEQTYEET